jgi:hypothetical protein
VQEIGVAFDPSLEHGVDEAPSAQEIPRVDQRDRLVVHEEIKKGTGVGGKDEGGGGRGRNKPAVTQGRTTTGAFGGGIDAPHVRPGW